ncbi:MAG: 3-oxoacyl-[acyl-carrier-protein] reductase [Christensenellales bacterium]
MNSVALVTGASGGIGQAICLKLAQDGFDIALHYNRGESKAMELMEKIRARGGRAAAIKADLSEPEQCASLVARCIEKLGGIYALVNNAGTTKDGLLMRMTDEQYFEVMRTNMDSCFYCTRAAVAHMAKARRGRIVNITSVVGLTGNAGQTNYAASKAAIIGFTKACAKEIASRGVCVNAIAPGFIATAMTDELSEDTRKKLMEAIPLRRLGTPEDVAALAGFLCGENASYITGQVLVVDGGMII